MHFNNGHLDSKKKQRKKITSWSEIFAPVPKVIANALGVIIKILITNKFRINQKMLETLFWENERNQKLYTACLTFKHSKTEKVL